MIKWLAIVMLLVGSPAFAQTPGSFVGTSTNKNAPPLSAAALNAALGTKADASGGVLTNPTISGGTGAFTARMSAGAPTPGAGDGTQLFTGVTWMPTCPAANCPGDPSGGPNTILAKAIFNGNSTDPHRPSFLISGSLYNTAGEGDPAAQHATAYFGQVQGAHAGGGWTLNTDIVRCGGTQGWDGTVGSGGGTGPDRCIPGSVAVTSATIGYELDFTNWDQDAGLGHGPFTPGIFINTLSSFTSTAGIFYGAVDAQPAPSWDAGIFFGANTIKSNGIFDGSSSVFSYQAAGSHSITFYDNSTSSYGFAANGSHSNADFWAADNAPIVLKINGTHTTLIDYGSVFSVSGTGAIVGTGLHTSGADALGLGTSKGNGLFVSDPGGTLANAIGIQPSTTGFGPAVKATGTDTNVSLELYSQGTGAIRMRTGNGIAFSVVDAGATIANNVAIQPNPAGFGPIIRAEGSDTNVPLNLQSKGASPIQTLSPLNVTGNITASTGFVAGANSGVSCSAGTVTLATLVITSGIVTHC